MKNKCFLSGLLVAAIVVISGCKATLPTLGGGQGGGTVTGSAGGASTQNANNQLKKCSEPLGTLFVFEDTSLP